MSKQNSLDILIIDDDRIILDSLCDFLSHEGYRTTAACSMSEANDLLKRREFALVITEMNLPDGSGFELLTGIKQNNPKTVVIIITGYGTIESAVESIKNGAYDYLTKPVIDDELVLAVERAKEWLLED